MWPGGRPTRHLNRTPTRRVTGGAPESDLPCRAGCPCPAGRITGLFGSHVRPVSTVRQAVTPTNRRAVKGLTFSTPQSITPPRHQALFSHDSCCRPLPPLHDNGGLTYTIGGGVHLCSTWWTPVKVGTFFPCSTQSRASTSKKGRHYTISCQQMHYFYAPSYKVTPKYEQLVTVLLREMRLINESRSDFGGRPKFSKGSSGCRRI
jgi:hypothetical protein